jgi:bifunctional DNA-binding transcriptional regulator/antitoxin component of YhaV-PrlF toxin-antitoxin module
VVRSSSDVVLSPSNLTLALGLDSQKEVESETDWRDNPSMHATIIDKKRRMTIPEEVCEAVGLKPHDQVEWRVEGGEIRGRRLVPQKHKEAFPPGSLLKYFTPQRDKDELAILSGCVKGPK